MKLTKLLLTTVLLIAGSFTALAQRTVSGIVTDAGGQCLPGAAVMVSGTTKGTVSGIDGTWTLEVQNGDVTLEISCLGFASATVKVPAGKSKVDVTLEEDSLMLDETVVVGYGTQKKVNLTGAVTSVKGDELLDRASSNVTLMLQGAVAGLNITTSSGVMNDTPDINIRGYTSINGASPMVLIDGAEGDLSRINAQDIESISVIKDAAAAAVYGARAAFGVILVTTKSGKSNTKATVRYNGKWGWSSPTTSTDYETRGYWSVYTINKFWDARYPGEQYLKYNENDMNELLARVNDVTENPSRPWVVEETSGGVRQWKYYGNTDWYHTLFSDNNPTQQQNLSITGGGEKFKYFISGTWDRQQGILKINPDVLNKYQLRARFEAKVNKWLSISNNTAFYNQKYSYLGAGNSIDKTLSWLTAHALPCFTLTNPDGSWVYYSQYFVNSYAVGNGIHAKFIEGNDKKIESQYEITNNTEINIQPIKQFKVTGNFNFRKRLKRNTYRGTNLLYKQYPTDEEARVRSSGIGDNYLEEQSTTYDYMSANVFATYEDTFNDHHVTAVVGGNWETQYSQYIMSKGYYLITNTLNDLSLAGTDENGESKQSVDGSQTEYALLGFFGRVNYDYKGRYLAEISARYDGTSRFASGHRWGFFPSASAGWRISEEPFFAPAKKSVSNLKLRASYGTLGNQVVSNYAYIRRVSVNTSSYLFGEGDLAKTASLSAPNAGDLTWENVQQYNLGIDAGFFQDRLQFTAEGYVRNTLGMLVEGASIPAVYGADAPKENSANLQTKGFELSISWRDQFNIGNYPFHYSISANMSNYDSIITKYDNNPNKLVDDYYVGRHLGEIWGFEANNLFATDAEAQEYAANVDLSYIMAGMGSTWQAGDLKYEDLDGDGTIGIGANTVDNPGDRKIIGNELPRLSYGATLSMEYFGFDFNIFFQGTGDHYWYPPRWCFSFWGPYSNPMQTFLRKDMLSDVWSETNTDAYFPRARGYIAEISGGSLNRTNTRYLQNCRYLRLKSLSVGYTIPVKLTKKIGIEKVRFYFTGENLACWSPLFDHCQYLDPEAMLHETSEASGRFYYPWQKNLMFGVEIQF